MDTKDNIESLFDSEELDQISETNTPELPKLESGIEKREFTRVEIAEKKVGVRFNNQLQFARQYIENISLGGLFVKTQEKHEMGQMVNIEFKVPHPSRPGEEINFLLKAKVCRITPNGVGLEFTNLDQEHRTLLEGYVQSVLPKGIDIRPKAKQSSLERVESMREAKRLSEAARKKTLIRILGVAALIATNSILIKESVEEFRRVPVQTNSLLRVDENNIDVRTIKSLTQTQDGTIWIEHSNGRTEVKNLNNLKELPPHLRHNLGILKSIPPAKEKRRSKNASGYINTRNRR